MNNTQFKKWSSTEEIDLLDEFKQGLDIQAISRKHDRSMNAIKLRLLELATRMHNRGSSEESIFKSTGCTLDDIKNKPQEKALGLNGLATHNLSIERKLDTILELLKNKN